MTEEQARTKVCPTAAHTGSKCVASDCMHWIQEVYAGAAPANKNGAAQLNLQIGYCGLSSTSTR